MCIKHGSILSYGVIIHGLLIDLKKSAKKTALSPAPRIHTFTPKTHVPKHGKTNQMAKRRSKKKHNLNSEKQTNANNKRSATQNAGFEERKQKKTNNNALSPHASAQHRV